MIDVRNKLAVVTGASGGIGLEFCKTLAELGSDLLMISIEDEPLKQAAEIIRQTYGIKTYPLTLDLCADDAVDRIRSFIENFKLSPYILINNAGIFSFAPVASIPEKKIDMFIDLHVRAATKLSITFAREFAFSGEESYISPESHQSASKFQKSGRFLKSKKLASKNQPKKGYILNMSSMSCWMPMPGIAMYSATKAYIRVFSRALNYEMRDLGVSVMVACPGGIATDLFGLPGNLKRLALRIGAIDRPDRFAQKAVKRMLKGKQQYINGLTNRLAIFFIGILPTSIRMMVKHHLLDKGITKP